MARLVRLPVVVVLGATGAGKSKAAFEIAVKFNGEIISADSMQIYKGLDIVTNKVSREEQQKVPHHMIDVVSPLKSDYNVHNFRQMVIPKIERILSESKLPVIVGGTNYYIESVLWDFLIGDIQSQADVKQQQTVMKKNFDEKQTSEVEAAKGSEIESPRYSVSEAQSLAMKEDSDNGIHSGLCTDEVEIIGDISTVTGHVSSHLSEAKTCIIEEDSLRNTEQVKTWTDFKSKCVSVESTCESLRNCSNSVYQQHTVHGEYRGKDVGEMSSGNLALLSRVQNDGDLTSVKTSGGDIWGTEHWKELSSVELHAKLKEVDQESALRLHPHNKRKIMRALEVYGQHQQQMSKLLKQQHNKQGASEVSGPLRYPNPCVIWVQCDQNVLDERTDKRVEQMVADGLLEELEGFHQEYNQQRLEDNGTADYTLGIFQSIGFKEFHSYLLLSSEQRQTEEGHKLFQKGLEDMKLATRRYARRQKKWIVGRFLKRRGQNVPPVYAVDSTDKEEWHDKVHKPACEIVESFIQEKPPPYPPLPVEKSTTQFLNNVCEICGGMVFVTLDQWESHLRSKRHQRQQKRLKRKAERKKKKSETDTQESTSF